MLKTSIYRKKRGNRHYLINGFGCYFLHFFKNIVSLYIDEKCINRASNRAAGYFLRAINMEKIDQ